MANTPIHIAVVAGETSGDRLGAGLIQELTKAYPHATFSGLGGELMAAQGCEILYDMERIGVMGFDGLASKLLDILRIRRSLLKHYSSIKPAVFIGIDVPDFNLTLEKGLKKRGIKTIHYVSPTVWAWRGYRIHKIRKAISYMLTLFPFEETYYQKQGIPVTCVGHPMADQITLPNRTQARETLGLSEGTIIAILPGSRKSEVKRLAVVLLDSVTMLTASNSRLKFILPFASEKIRGVFNQVVGDISHLPIETFNGQSRLVMEAANLVILASGTAALEAALLRRVHIVIYKLPKFSYWLLQKLRHVDHYAMPNHLLEKPMIPELMQENATPKNVVSHVNAYLENPQKMMQLENKLGEIHTQLKRNANVQAAAVVKKVISEQECI